MKIIMFGAMMTAIIAYAFRQEWDDFEAYYNDIDRAKKFKMHWIYRAKNTLQDKWN